MKVAIYSPYLDTAGGGEKYMLTIAEALSEKEDVDVLIDKHLLLLGVEGIKNRCQSLHGLDLSKVDFVTAPIGKESSFLERLIFLRAYDWFFYNTDGSIFLSTAKNSVIHFQMPLDAVAIKNLWGRIKLRSWRGAIYNSLFTKKFIEDRWSIRGVVFNPPVDVSQFRSLKKKKQIVSVGRFEGSTKAKKHSIMIEMFKRLSCSESLRGWSLHLAGGATGGDCIYLEQLKDEAKDYNIFFHPNIALPDLIQLYGESSIYWHAMGYGEEDPKMSEHFGITTVEAMASGCVPVVINKGGQREIVEDKISGFLWNDLSEFQDMTLKVVSNEKLRGALSKNAQKKAQVYSKENFVNDLLSLVYEK